MREHLKKARRLTVACAFVLSAGAGLAACGSEEEPASSGHSALCADEVTFRGIDYSASGPTGGPPADLPADPVQGRHLGRTKRCDDVRGVDADGSPVGRTDVWLQVYEIKGIDPEHGIYVESFGPMTPVDRASATG